MADALKRDTREMLTRRLAALEAPWTPLRAHEWKAGPTISEARRNGGVRIWGEGGNARRRKASQRSRDEATEAGLMRGDALTDEGKRVVRGWSWTYTIKQVYRALGRICDAVEREDRMPDGFVPEQLICGAEWGDAVFDLGRMFAPLLADGALLSQSTTTGRAFYRIEEPATIVAAVASLIVDGFDAELALLYDSEFRRCRRLMLGDTARRQDIGEIPCIAHPLISRRSHNDLTDIAPLFSATMIGATDG